MAYAPVVLARYFEEKDPEKEKEVFREETLRRWQRRGHHVVMDSLLSRNTDQSLPSSWSGLLFPEMHLFSPPPLLHVPPHKRYLFDVLHTNLG